MAAQGVEDRTIGLNTVEMSLLVAALRGHMRQIGGTDQQELNFTDGLRARIAGLLRSGHDSECWCQNCGWHGPRGEDRCSCGAELRVCRGGVKIHEARGAERGAARRASEEARR